MSTVCAGASALTLTHLHTLCSFIEFQDHIKHEGMSEAELQLQFVFESIDLV